MTRVNRSFGSDSAWRSYWPIFLTASISTLLYLAASSLVLGIGFPLDDAWIHQTYARNFGLRGEWAFLPGQPSAGSTSPMWSLLLALGYWLRVSPYVWTFLLGWLCLTSVGLIGSRIVQRTNPSIRLFAILAGCFLVLEWHLVWSAVSGMETLLFSLITLLLLSGLIERQPSWFGQGLLVGVSVWLRPDGITLALPLLLAAAFSMSEWRLRWKAWISGLAGISIFVIPYLLFNLSLSGSWLPNTFYAKQAEYEILSQIPFGKRFFQQLISVMVGPEVILLPGFLLGIHRQYRKLDWGSLGMAIWVIAYLGIYALRLPAAYQHGRYLMPVLPVFCILSLLGLFDWMSQGQQDMWRRILSRSWGISLFLLTLVFFFLGGRAYAQDVAVIESEMVATARWIARSTPENALIAAHDIGALGYYGDRRLLDLAGLISPEVIPFIRDENRLAMYLDQKEADYLMTFPGWYPNLIRKARLVFDSGGRFSPNLGGENMQVYRWR